jgi:aspartate carbamoyltransferase catalytic subunit
MSIETIMHDSHTSITVEPSLRKPRHIIGTSDFSRPLLEELFAAAAAMERDDVFRAIPQSLRGRILATLFYEPSTRTRFSFESAMQKLGGGVITAENMRESSSAIKGETIADTVRIVSGYADIIAIRHFERGTAAAAAAASPVPVINAGDGIGEHPTQALTDLYTIRKELGRLTGLRLALVGDLLNGRTIHSLIRALTMYEGITLDLLSPAELRLPSEYLDILRTSGVRFTESTSLDDALPHADVAYITRVQKERFTTEEAYLQVRDAYVLNVAGTEKLKSDGIIMHALPRVNEIAPEVDQDSRAAYFRQAKNGLYVRMALLNYLLA